MSSSASRKRRRISFLKSVVKSFAETRCITQNKSQAGEFFVQSSIQAIIALILLIHTSQHMQHPKRRKRLIGALILFLVSIIFQIVGTNKITQHSNEFYEPFLYAQNIPGKIVLVILMGASVNNNSGRTVLTDKSLGAVLLLNELLIVHAALFQRSDMGDKDIANKFLVSSIFGFAATMLYMRYKFHNATTDAASRFLLVIFVFVTTAVTIDLAQQVAAEFPPNSNNIFKSYGSFIGWNVLLIMPYLFTRIHLPFNLRNEPQQSSQPSISMQEPVVGSSAEPVSNTYGVNIVEVNAGENIPTAVAVPVAG